MLNDKHLWSSLNVGRAAGAEVEVKPGTKQLISFHRRSLNLLRGISLVNKPTWQSPFLWSICRCSCGRSSRGQWSNRESRSHPLLRWKCLVVPAFTVYWSLLVKVLNKPRYKTKRLHILNNSPPCSRDESQRAWWSSRCRRMQWQEEQLVGGRYT